MEFVNRVKEISFKNRDKKIAMFCDMDGTIVNLELHKYQDVLDNKPGLFLHRRPLKTVINALEEISKLENIDMFILSACKYKEQALDKSVWLEENANFFKKENQLFVVQELTKYNDQNKKTIKTNNIVQTLENRDYDLAIYLDDEYKMLNEADKLLGDKVVPFHISNLID